MSAPDCQYTQNEWKNLLNDILLCGTEVVCREHHILEIKGEKSIIPMCFPLITLSKRKLGYRFACAEAAWILSGDNRVDTIKPYSKMIGDFSNDGVFFYGAYGPKILDQLEYIGRALQKDIYSRQAVLTIWREKPSITSSDIPCTLSIQFLVRDGENGELVLHLFDNMRSSDSWLGVPYDWFSFSMVAAYFCLYFHRITGKKLLLGNLYFYAASQHLYTKSFGYSIKDVSDMLFEDKLDFEYEPLDPYEFSSMDEFVDYLWGLARDKERNRNVKWLKELVSFWRKRDLNAKVPL
jgi:thymidylate synthase